MAQDTIPQMRLTKLQDINRCHLLVKKHLHMSIKAKEIHLEHRQPVSSYHPKPECAERYAQRTP